ncbi:MAG TPA: hypothetical protein VKA01_05680 [Vicinamibacteria bacterium]|nr:hypothetical protein [Vicinamibacteria bacterium]
MRTGAAALLSVLVAGITGGSAGMPEDDRVMPRVREEALREDALSRAQLWREPPPARRTSLRRNPSGPHAFGSADRMSCRFHLEETSGSTNKFKCTFANGEVLKVKYRSSEVHTEVAASRLLEALGAGADHMYLVDSLRCFGCPADPDTLLRCISSPYGDLRQRCAESFGGRPTPTGDVAITIDYSTFVDFEIVSIERRLEGESIVGDQSEGWGWDELDAASSTRATRAERDALRLLAVLLNNWDNRRSNQRLLCLPGALRADGTCARPFAYMHDTGATFGWTKGEKDERKLDVEGWRQVGVWKDPAACVVRIASPPLHGATFGEATISESGRRFLVDRLRRVPEKEIRALFEGARFADFEGASPESRDIDNWVKAFQGKVREIAERPPCPTL